MRRCAFLTTDNLGDMVADDHLAIEPLRRLGWKTDTVPWQARGAHWGDYDLIVIRSTWDYHERTEEFLDVLDEIESSTTLLANPVALVKWNATKTYLREIEDAGVPIVPTTWLDRLDPKQLPELVGAFDDSDVILKPVVGASANGVFRTNERLISSQHVAIESYFADRALMVQPLAKYVQSEGEFSLFYFNGTLSHAVLKTPKEKDFRVQGELGGTTKLVDVEPKLRVGGDKVMSFAANVGEQSRPPLYARVDFIRANDGGEFWLIELELIEPSLFLQKDPGSASRFATAIDEYVRAS